MLFCSVSTKICPHSAFACAIVRAACASFWSLKLTEYVRDRHITDLPCNPVVTCLDKCRIATITTVHHQTVHQISLKHRTAQNSTVDTPQSTIYISTIPVEEILGPKSSVLSTSCSEPSSRGIVRYFPRYSTVNNSTFSSHGAVAQGVVYHVLLIQRSRARRYTTKYTGC